MGKIEERLRYNRRVEAMRKERPGRRELTIFVDAIGGDESVMEIEVLTYGATPLITIGAIGQLIRKLEGIADQAEDPQHTRLLAQQLQRAYEQLFLAEPAGGRNLQ